MWQPVYTIDREIELYMDIMIAIRVVSAKI